MRASILHFFLTLGVGLVLFLSGALGGLAGMSSALHSDAESNYGIRLGCPVGFLGAIVGGVLFARAEHGGLRIALIATVITFLVSLIFVELYVASNLG